MGFLEFVFGTRRRKVKEYLKKNAVILDVRTQKEWDKGHIEKSMHVPLADIHNQVEELKALNKPFIVCCEAGVRAAKATKYLTLNNMDAVNGGGWASLKDML